MGISIDNFENALLRLEEAINNFKGAEVERDSTILRYQLTYETFWKALKHYFEKVAGIEVNAPRTAIKAAYQQKWLEGNEDLWLMMVLDRNLIVRTYNEEQSIDIYEHIHQFTSLLRAALEKLKNLTE